MLDYVVVPGVCGPVRGQRWGRPKRGAGGALVQHWSSQHRGVYGPSTNLHLSYAPFAVAGPQRSRLAYVRYTPSPAPTPAHRCGTHISSMHSSYCNAVPVTPPERTSRLDAIKRNHKVKRFLRESKCTGGISEAVSYLYMSGELQRAPCPWYTTAVAGSQSEGVASALCLVYAEYDLAKALQQFHEDTQWEDEMRQ